MQNKSLFLSLIVFYIKLNKERIMKILDFKDKARALNNELNTYGAKLKHAQILNILAKIEGYKTYADYKAIQEEKHTQTVNINKETWDSFVAKRKDFGVPIEEQLEMLIEQEIYQVKDDVKLYKYEDSHFDTYLVFAKSKRDALAIIDGSYLPPDIYDIERVKEVSLETLYGIMIANRWKGIDDDGTYHQYRSELVDVDGSVAFFSETLISYDRILQSMDFYEYQVLNHDDEQILEYLKEEKEKDPEKYKKYIELHETVLSVNEIVKGGE